MSSQMESLRTRADLLKVERDAAVARLGEASEDTSRVDIRKLEKRAQSLSVRLDDVRLAFANEVYRQAEPLMRFRGPIARLAAREN